jgi:hypothetical protein
MTKTSFKIPPFLSAYLEGMTKEEKDEAVQQYKSWYNNNFTQMYVQYLEDRAEQLVKEEEDKTDFLSWFQFSYKTAHNRAKRSLLRELAKKLNYKV